MRKKALTKKERKFLIGLEKLSRKTGVVIGGCGCCGSPWVSEIDEAALDEKAGYAMTQDDGGINWVSPSDEYDWKEYHESIIKENNNVGKN
jgi:hypothetical protein